MKLVNVYPEGLIVRTIPYKKPDGRFEMTDRCQKSRSPVAAAGWPNRPARFREGQLRLCSRPPVRRGPALGKRDLLGKLMKKFPDILLPSRASLSNAGNVPSHAPFFTPTRTD